MYALRSNRGISLVSVTIAVGILGVVAATLVTLFGNMSTLLLRSNSGSEEDSLIQLVKGILDQPELCDRALRANPGINQPADVVWDFGAGLPASPIHHIEANRPPGVDATIAVSLGGPLGPFQPYQITPNVALTSIRIRQPSVALGEHPPSVSTVYRNKILYDTTTAKLVFTFSDASFPGGGEQHIKTLDLAVAVNNTSKILEFCYQEQRIQAMGKPCLGPADLYEGLPVGTNAAVDCGIPPGTPPPSGCQNMYYIAGFDVVGTPKCLCRVNCQAGGAAASSPGPSATAPPY